MWSCHSSDVKYLCLPGCCLVLAAKQFVWCFSVKVEASWNVMAHAQKPDFLFLRNGRVHLNRRGCQFSRLLAAEVCASAVVMPDTPCSEVVWRVLATHSIHQFPLHFPSGASPCAITFQLDSTTVPGSISNNVSINTWFSFSSKILLHVYRTTWHHIPEDDDLNVVTAACIQFSLSAQRSVRWRGNSSQYYQPQINKHYNLKIIKYCIVSNLISGLKNIFSY
jgi:hypothetical protein